MWRNRKEGQAVVLAALAFVILVGAAGLALDGANAFNQRRNTNNAADAAAMAGIHALLEAKKNGSPTTNNVVLQAITTYLNTHLPNTSARQVHAYYVNTVGGTAGQINSTTASQALPNVGIDTADTSLVRGVAVEVHWTFDTFFMGLLGQETLSVDGYGLALAGPLGGATGSAVIPLAIRDEEAQRWQRDADKSDQWSMMIYTDTTSLDPTPPLTIRQFNLAYIALIPIEDDNPAPDSGSNCSDTDTLAYWWCNGTDASIETKSVTINSTPLTSASNSLKPLIKAREDSDVLMPVYTSLDLDGHVRIVGFMAVHITDFSNGRKILKGRIISYYNAPGPITGETVSFFDAYALNLVR